MQNSPQVVEASAALYERLLNLYPRRYRRRFKSEMVQVFRQVCIEIYLDGGFLALMVLWLTTAGDLLKTTVEERLNQVFNMRRDIFIPVAGWSFMVWGFLLIAAAVSSGQPDPGFAYAYNPFETIFWYAGSLFFAVGLGGLYARYGKTLGWLGKFGLLQGIPLGLVSALRVSWLPVVATLAGVPISSLERFDVLVLLVALGSGMVGLILLGVDTLMTGSPPKWKFLPLITGSSGMLLVIVAAINLDYAAGLIPLAMIMALGVALTGFFLQADPAPRKQKATA